tara:strand:+ start:657 stop:974 length:318 start_codon:yes stop_codon:yes gene_type:complete
MKRLLLSLLFIPFFTSISWANPIEIRSDDMDSIDMDNNDYRGWEDSVNIDGEMNDPLADIDSIDKYQNKTKKKKSLEQGQQRPSGWRRKPTSIQRNPGGLKRRAR